MQPSSEHPLVGVLTKEKVTVNRQEFRNSPLASDSLTKEYMGSAQAFAGDKNPNLAILTEKPEHRIIMFLRAKGNSPMEIAKATGYSYQWVCQIVRQPWFKKRLLETIQEAGQDGVENFLKGEVLPSLVTLAEVRDNPDAPSAARVAASNSILDRFLGKPTQHIKTEKVTTDEGAKTEMSQIERELAAIRQQQKAVAPSIASQN